MDIETLRSQMNDYITINRKEVYFDGLRWKLGINTNPCIQSRKGKRCVFCGFLNHQRTVSPLQVGQVFNAVFRNSDLREIKRVELYVSGSFFDNEEVLLGSRLEVVNSVREVGIEELVVESRPEFIVEERLKPLADLIDPKRITIAVGVETMDDELRHRLSKGFSLEELKRSLGCIAQAGMNFQAYLMLGAPGTNDREAIIDVMRSAQQMVSMTREMNCPLTLAIQPFFLANGSTIVQDGFRDDKVRPPWLYTVSLTMRLLDKMRAGEGSVFRLLLGNEVDNVEVILAASNYTGDGTCESDTKE